MRERYASQLSTSAWHQWLVEPTVFDAIMDRLLHGAYTIALKGGAVIHALHPGGPASHGTLSAISGICIAVRDHADDIIDL